MMLIACQRFFKCAVLLIRSGLYELRIEPLFIQFQPWFYVAKTAKMQ